jgi:hypothetical protein
MAKTSVIPTGAERSEAQWRDLFWCLGSKKRSLDYAALWAASLGMTEWIVICDSPAHQRKRRKLGASHVRHC